MGNQPSNVLQTDSDYCKGRDDIIDAIKESIQGNNGNVVAISGQPNIGKSTILIKTFLKQKETIGTNGYFLYYNFKDCDSFDFQPQAEHAWFKKLMVLNEQEGIAIENNQDYGTLLSALVTLETTRHKTVYLYLDNVDVLSKWSETTFAEFLEFVKTSVRTHNNMKILFSTSTQIVQTRRRPMVFKIPPLANEFMCEIITSECEDQGVEIDDSQRLCIPLIATLCDGIPYAAATAGSILSENGGLFTPCELLELMIIERLDVLSPSNYAVSDRLDAMTKPIRDQEQKEEVRVFLSNLIKNKSREVTEKEAQSCNGDSDVSSAMFKKSVLRPLLTSFILAKEKDLVLPSVFKECKIALDTRRAEECVNTEQMEQMEDYKLDMSRDHLKRLELQFKITDEMNQKDLETYLQTLVQTKPVHEEEKPEEDSDEDDSLSEILEEMGLGDRGALGGYRECAETPEEYVRQNGDGADEELPKEKDQSSMHKGLSSLSLVPGVNTSKAKPKNSVRYADNGNGLEFQQITYSETRPKEVYESNSSNDVVYAKLESVTESPQNSFHTLSKPDRSEMKDHSIQLVPKEHIKKQGTESRNHGNEVYGLSELAIAIPGVPMIEVGHKKNESLQHASMVRAEVLSLQSAGPLALNDYNAQPSETSGELSATYAVPRVTNDLGAIKVPVLRTQGSTDSGIGSPDVKEIAPQY